MKPDYRNAHNIAGRAIAKGMLVRQPCCRCGKTPVEAHHEDYSKPLDVTWLCLKCHGARHRELNLDAGINNEMRTTLNLPAEMNELIDNYWHSEQLRTRNEAIRELIRAGLDAKLAKPAKETPVAQNRVEQAHALAQESLDKLRAANNLLQSFKTNETAEVVVRDI